jgi:hypothetical protein
VSRSGRTLPESNLLEKNGCETRAGYNQGHASGSTRTREERRQVGNDSNHAAGHGTQGQTNFAEQSFGVSVGHL